MDRVERYRMVLRRTIVVGAAILLLPVAGWGVDRPDPYTSMRDATRAYIDPGSPDDLLRLRDALDKTEEEIAKLKLEIPPEQQEALVEKRKAMKELKDRLAESEALLQLLDRSGKELPKKRLDPVTAKERDRLRSALMSRTEGLREAIARLEQDSRFGQADYLRVLEEEQRALTELVTMRRERLLAEYETLAGCTTDDRPCLARKLKILCRLAPLFHSADRAPILILLDDVATELHLRLEGGTSRPTVGHGSSSALCEYLRRDFAL
jgi:hypothetical protein